MRFAGISELAIFGGLSSSGAFNAHVQAEHVANFCGHFPDQGNYVATAAAELQCTTYSELQQHIQYSGPPELLSMHMCFFMTEAISGDPRRAHAAALAHEAAHGSLPSPRRLAELVRGST